MNQQDETNKTHVIIVDPHPLVREGIRGSLHKDASIEVVAEAGDATAALFAGKQHGHDVLVLNAFLPNVNVFDVINEHKKAFTDTRVVICHAPEDPAFLQELLESGTDAMIGQEAMSCEYLAATNAVMAGGAYVSANLLECLVFFRKTFRSRTNAYNLTDRETEILALLANGLSNKEIANRLDLSVRTAEAHRLSIRRKTEANTLSDLIRIARSVGVAAATSTPLLGHSSGMSMPVYKTANVEG